MSSETELVPAKIELDESKYGKRYKGEWNWSFKVENKSGGYDLITVGNSEGPVLIAVTKEQYNSWKNRKIFAFKRSPLQYRIKKIMRFLSGAYEYFRKLFSISFWKAKW